MIAYYNPWVDAILITSWKIVNGRPMIYDVELLTGDFLRNYGGPPFDLIPLWLRKRNDPPPVAVFDSAIETMKIFREVFSQALPDTWRMEYENLTNPEILADNYISVSVMLLERLKSIILLIKNKDMEPVKDAMLKTLETLENGNLSQVLSKTETTPNCAKNP